MEKNKIVYADCPWSFNDKNTGGSYKSGSENHYPVMTVDEICALPVNRITDIDCILFLWWVGSQPEEALRVVKSWGFTLKTMTGFVWNKKTKHGKPFFGMGHWTRAGSEACLIATKGKPKRISGSVRSVVDHPVLAHSEKPDIFRKKIIELIGDLPRIELFGRKKIA